MDRRRLLRALGAGTALLGGCIGRTDDPSGGSPDSTTTATRTTTGSGTGTATDGGRTLSVERVETSDYALRLNDVGNSPRGPVPSLADLDDRQREVVTAALDGGYDADDPPSWLVDFLAGTPFVRRDGRFYRLRNDLPTYTVAAEPVAGSEVDGETASNEAYREAVTHDGRVMTGLLRNARRGGTELAALWPGLREFLDRYDAVRFRGETLSVSLTVDDPGPPYTVTAKPATLDEVAGQSVWNADGARPALREVVREAGRADGLYALDDPPDGLLGKLDAHDLVHLDGRFFTTYVETRGSLPVSMEASVTDAGLDGDAALRLALRNDADATVRLLTGAPRPFGVCYYHPVGEPEERRLLWTDAYEESDAVTVEDGEVTAVYDVGLAVEVPPGDEAAHTFAVRETDLSAGEYVVEGDVGVELPDREGGSLPYRVVLRVS